MRVTVNKQVLRFAVIGGINTALDFGILIILKTLGLPVIPANIISTSVALTFSFFANRKYTFKGHGDNLRYQVISFLVVTLFGLWVIQNLIIIGIDAAVAPLHLQPIIQLVGAKLVASVASLTWNYVLYSRIVFKKASSEVA